MNINETISTIMQSTEIPLLTAFVLGLLTALNPCQLAINVSALSYQYKNGSQWSDALMYTFGRSITYTLLGWVIMCLLGGGRNISGFELALSRSEEILPYVLVAMGCFMFSRTFRHHHHDGETCHNSGKIIRRNGPMGSLILGMTLAFAFCPESAVFYFGIAIPLAVTSTAGILIPFIFAIAASLPVILISRLMLTAASKARHFTHNFEHAQQILNCTTGILFIIIALLLFME